MKIKFVTFTDKNNLNLVDNLVKSLLLHYDSPDIFIGIDDEAESEIANSNYFFVDKVTVGNVSEFIKNIERDSMPDHISKMGFSRLFLSDIIDKFKLEKADSYVYLDNDIVSMQKIPERFFDTDKNIVVQYRNKIAKGIRHGKRKYSDFDEMELSQNRYRAVENTFFSKNFEHWKDVVAKKPELEKILKGFDERLVISGEFCNSGVVIINDLNKYDQIIKDINKVQAEEDINLFEIFSDEILINIFKNDGFITSNDYSLNFLLTKRDHRFHFYKRDKNCIFLHCVGHDKSHQSKELKKLQKKKKL